MNTGQSFLIGTPAFSQHSTVPLEDTISLHPTLWPCLLPRHLPEEDGPDPRGVPRMHWDHRQTSLSTATPKQNMMHLSTKPHVRLPANMIWCLTHKNTREGSSC